MLPELYYHVTALPTIVVSDELKDHLSNAHCPLGDVAGFLVV